MRLIKFVIVFTLTIALVTIFNLHHPFGSSTPPLAPLLNPFTGFWQNAPAEESFKNVTLKMEGLSGEVKVIFDDRLVPHIFAQSLDDAYYAQGYVTAMHRLWQMDLSVRAVGGRLSEVLGERTLERDQLQRRKGMMAAAKNAIKSWERNPEEVQTLEAYIAGVNAFIQGLSPKTLPLGYKILNFEPEPWTPLHSALFSKSMAEILCFRNYDIRATNAKTIFGDELYDFLYPEYNPEQDPIIPANTAWQFDSLVQKKEMDPLPTSLTEVIPHRHLPMSPEFVGSNNWAVSGSKTASGSPILANDPHLGLTLPSIWYEIHLHTPEMKVYGVSLPGIPGVMIGFNEDIAWGITNAGHDVVDWYRMEWTDEDKNAYYLDGQVYEVEPVVEAIRVRGQATVLDTVKYTEWGPIVYEDPSSPHFDLAMRWVANDYPEEREFYDLGAFTRLNMAKNHDDYVHALKGYDSPAQNFVFASREGDIALRVNGRLPIKKEGQGRFIQEGNTTANAWDGFIPKNQIPAALNPEQGFIASANQRSTAANYPYYYNGGFDDYRGRVINRFLRELDGLTAEDMMSLQNNTFSIHAEEGTQAMMQMLNESDLSEEELGWSKKLADWDYQFNKESKEAILFKAWESQTYENTFDEVMALADSVDIQYPESWRFISLLEDYPTHQIFDDQRTPDKETAREIVTRSFKQALAANLEKLMEEDYLWSDFNGANIRHISGLPGFGYDRIETGGYAHALNAVRNNHGPSWRMVVELGEEVTAHGIYPGGQSGHPGSRFYDNMVQDWAKGHYYRLLFVDSPEDLASYQLYQIQMKK